MWCHIHNVHYKCIQLKSWNSFHSIKRVEAGAGEMDGTVVKVKALAVLLEEQTSVSWNVYEVV